MADHDYREFYEKDYLGAWNIPESGELTVTIVKCVQGELNNPGTKKKTKKPVVFIEESEKQFALNATNGKTIAALYGNKVSAWAGKRITLFKSMTRNPAGGDDVECLRIRPKVPSGAKAREPAATPYSQTSTEFPDARPGSSASAAAYISPEQVIMLETLCNDGGISVDALKKKGKVERLAMLEAERFDGCVAWIKAAIAARQEVA